MRVIFMGTPEFAVPSLEALLDSRHEVTAVVTGVDKPSGRSLQISESAVKRAARRHELPLLQPDDLRDPFFIRAMTGFSSDVCLVVAFRILPPEVYNIPSLGCVNLHPSLLPELRGAAPINWALMNGLPRTGLTTFIIERRVDTGEMLLQEPVDIEPDDDAGTLSDRLADLGARLVIKTLDRLETGELTPRPQTGDVTKAPRLTRDTCRIDWSRPAEELHNQVRGLSPTPGAFTILNRKVLKILRTRTLEDVGNGEPGLVVGEIEDTLAIWTGSGVLGIVELQMEGRRRMTAGEFLRGKSLPPGAKFG